jgi:SNF2 family DNA or RNA helicase
VLRRIVNSDPSRLSKLKEIVDYHMKVIIFYNYDYELEMLRQFCEDNKYIYSEWNGHKHQDIPDTDFWVYLVQYTAGAEGWNCISTNTIIFYSLNYSYKTNEQAKGRIDRINTPFINLYYYYLISKSGIDRAIQDCLYKKEDFNEKKFVDS